MLKSSWLCFFVVDTVDSTCSGPRRQWIHDIEEWTGCKYIQLKEMYKIEHNGEERYWGGRLLSPTLIEEGRLVSE